MQVGPRDVQLLPEKLAALAGEEEVRVLAATGQLGYGIPEDSLTRGFARRPHVIGADLGSTDPGPFALGSGRDPRAQGVVERDLRLILDGAHDLGVPVILGSAGLAGTNDQVDVVAEHIRRISAERGRTIRLATIHAEVPREWVVAEHEGGRLRAIDGAPSVSTQDIRDSTRIVGQMGPEPLVRALQLGADVVLAGRACDTAVFAALPLALGRDAGLTTHMSKIIECASQCAEPGGRDAILGIVREDHFTVESMHPGRRCTPQGVAAHSLYEQADPFRTAEPGGTLDISASSYEALDDRITKVSGSVWTPADAYTIKLEGAALAGYRTFSLGGVRDPLLLGQLRQMVDEVAVLVAKVVPGGKDDYELSFRCYGYDAVLQERETQSFAGHEAAVLIDVVAVDQDLANAVCATARQYLLHHFYPGIVGTGGNLAFPFSPSEFDAGAVYRFSLYHTVPVEPHDLFDIEIREVGA